MADHAGTDQVGFGESFADALRARIPQAKSDASAVTTSPYLTMQSIVSNEYLDRASRLVLTLAATDFDELLHCCLEGLGRGAIRAARTLIEHSINLQTVISEDLSDRYMAHLNLGPMLMADFDYTNFGLNKKQRSSNMHGLLRASRAARQPWEESLRTYGKSFRTKWVEESLYDRAVKYGLENFYHAYRLASNVTHGSAGGAVGHFSILPGSEDTGAYIAGRVSALVPFALVAGCDAYLEMFKRAALADQDVRADAVVHNIQVFLSKYYPAIWHESREARRRQEAAFARGDAVGTALLVFSKSGKRKWYTQVGNQVADFLVRGVPDGYILDLQEKIDPLLQAYISRFDFFTEGGLAGVEVPATALSIDINSPRMPANAIYPRLRLDPQNVSVWRVTDWQAGQEIVLDQYLSGPDSYLPPGSFSINDVDEITLTSTIYLDLD